MRRYADYVRYCERSPFRAFDNRQGRNIVVYGNCHAFVIAYLLQQSEFVRDQFNIQVVVPYLLINPPREHVRQAVSKLVSQAEIFVHVRIHSPKYGFFATDAIAGKLPARCIRCRVPNFMLFYMFLSELADCKSELQSLIQDCVSVKQLRERVISLKIEKYTASTCKFLQESNECAISMTDYVMANLTQRRLLLQRYHPTTAYFVELCQRILSFLNLPPLAPANISEFQKNEDVCELGGRQKYCDVDKTIHDLQFLRDEETIPHEQVIDEIVRGIAVRPKN